MAEQSRGRLVPVRVLLAHPEFDESAERRQKDHVCEIGAFACHKYSSLLQHCKLLGDGKRAKVDGSVGQASGWDGSWSGK
jgi:hypothetical protein